MQPRLHEDRLVASLKGAPVFSAETIEAIPKSALQPVDPINQVSVGCLQRQMVMIPHHAVGVKPPAHPLTGLKEAVDECLGRSRRIK